MTERLDLSVAIERVRVRTCVTGERRGPLYLTGHAGAPGASLHDHRIVIRALHVDIEAALDDAPARRLGAQVARALASGLAGLQDRRAERVARAPETGGPIHVEAMRAYVRGEVDRHPASSQIAAALQHAFEQRTGHA